MKEKPDNGDYRLVNRFNMKLSFQHWLIIIVVILITATGISTYKLIQEQERSKSFEASLNILENDHKSLIQENLDLIDSLEKVKRDRGDIIEKRHKKIEEQLAYIESILKNKDDEKSVDNMRNSDSIHQLFTRYYPGN